MEQTWLELIQLSVTKSIPGPLNSDSCLKKGLHSVVYVTGYLSEDQ